MMQSNSHQKPEIYYARPCRPRFIEARVSTFVALTRNVTRFGVSSVETIRSRQRRAKADAGRSWMVSDAMGTDTARADCSNWQASATRSGSLPSCRPKAPSISPLNSASRLGSSPHACPAPRSHGCTALKEATRPRCSLCSPSFARALRPRWRGKQTWRAASRPGGMGSGGTVKLTESRWPSVSCFAEREAPDWAGLGQIHGRGGRHRPRHPSTAA